MQRRELIERAGALLGLVAASGCTHLAPWSRDREDAFDPVRGLPDALDRPPVIARPRVRTDRIVAISVCTRPFRAQGPRLDAEQIGDKLVVHNYGHGGSGWSLSWGSSTLAVEKALATGEREVAVIGCGALGLTSALLLQRAGAQVTIYAKDLPPDVRSSFATGVWSPDSRICLEEHATPSFAALWETMARTSFRTFQRSLGLPGEPVTWLDDYALAEQPFVEKTGKNLAEKPPITFARFGKRLLDLTPAGVDLPPSSHPFPTPYVRHSTNMVFHLTAYAHHLLTDFRLHGGRIEVREFHAPADLKSLPQKAIIHATGYGARALFDDRTLTPVRGQLARLMPQPELAYSIHYDGVAMLPRKDGVVIQSHPADPRAGLGDESTTPDRAETEQAVLKIARIATRMAL